MSGIISILATGGRFLREEESVVLSASGDHKSTNPAEHWSDKFAALASLPTTCDAGGRSVRSIATDSLLGTVCAFDGKLHNAADLTAELGAVCKGTDYSGLVVRAYARWGETFASRLRGEFALVIWDAGTKRLLCARDPIGIKFLYIYDTGHSCIVASSLADLIRLYGPSITVNTKAIAAYLSGDPLTTDTFYAGIAKLPASTTLVISAKNGAQRRFRHWNLSDIRPVRYPRSEDYAQHFLDVFSDSIRCRLADKSYTGLLLSGGLDSSSIACVAAGLVTSESPGTASLMTFSVTSDHQMADADGDIFDETPYIDSVLRFYGLNARVFRYDDFLTDDEFTQPTRGALPIPPGMGVFRKIFASASQQGVTVMLSGIGGDEILGSNSDIYLLRYADLIASKNARELIDDLKHAHKYYPWHRVAGLLWRYGCWPVLRYIATLLLAAECRWAPALSFSQRKTYTILESGELAGYGLEAFDMLCRNEGLEACYPYLDLRLVEFCLAVPSAELSRHYQTKLLLRRSMAGILPDKVRLRTGKASSTSLLHTWLSGAMRQRVESLLAQPTLSRGVDWDLIRKLFADYCCGNMDHSRYITKAIGLELWHRANN